MFRSPRARLGVTIAALALLVSGCAGPGIEPPPPPLPRALHVGPDSLVRFAAVGDSITAWDSLEPPTGSWIATVVTPRIEFVGGWAVPGATTADMMAGVADVPPADVLVVMAGTNDFLPDFPDYTPQRTVETIEAIVAATGIEHVVLSAIAPNDYRQAQTAELNIELARTARLEGWVWVDPWTSVRQPDGRFALGSTIDGVHPTDEVEAVAGEQLRAAIIACARAAEETSARQ